MNYYNEKFPIVKSMIALLYDYCPTGGCCHVVTDDDNIYDEDLDWTIEYSQREENKNCVDTELTVAICKCLRSMSFLQRAVLFDSFNYEVNDFDDKESFDLIYDTSIENLNKVYKSYDYQNKFKEVIDATEEN